MTAMIRSPQSTMTENAAATKIQAIHRGRQDRKRVEDLKKEKMSQKNGEGLTGDKRRIL